MKDVKKDSNTFDAIIIGSGIGGLTTGAILTKLNKKRVLILEKHFEIGGLTHVFSRGRYKWEVGVHYIGRMHEGVLQRVMIDYITEKRLHWIPIPAPFERFIYPDFSFGVHSNPKKYREELIEKFPSSKKQIKRYFRDIKRGADWFARYYLSGFLPQPVSGLLRIINYFTKRIPLSTTEEYLRHSITDKKLAAVLTTQWGDYGAPPCESAFVIHAAIVSHYMNGAFFPEGGSNRIASTIENVIERNGGMILVNRVVKEIIIKNNRAVGVRVIDKRFLTDREETFYAPLIISNAGTEHTFNQLVNVPSTRKLKDITQSLEKGYSAVTLYVGLKESPEKLGVHGENIWINTKYEHGTIREKTEALLAGKPNSCYVSFPSVRGGQHMNHIAVVITLVDYSAFSKWQNQLWRMKDVSYYKLKTKLAASLIDLVEQQLPGFSDLITYSEVSTPLTMEYFTNRSRGAMYSFKPTPRYFSDKWFKPITPVKGLSLTGTDVCAPGITGAMMGGIAAASNLNGPFGLIKIVASARIEARKKKLPYSVPSPKSIRPQYALSSDKVLAKLVEKIQLTDSIFEFRYQVPKEIDYCPGQYARIQYSDADYGSYSIVSANEGHIQFIIETKFGGAYADYFTSLKPGDYSTIRLPLGDFNVRQNDNKKVFISTGTGIAPQIAMMDLVSNNSFDEKIDVYFGCRYAKDNFIQRYLKDLEKKVIVDSKICISREEKNGCIYGRVTKPLKSLTKDLDNYDFYISGNPSMVAETVDILRNKGASNIYSENY